MRLSTGGYDYDNVTIVGTTRYVLGPLFQGKIRGMIVCGGGLISLNEFQEFLRKGYRCIYVALEAKFKIVDTSISDEHSAYAKYGLVQKWVRTRCRLTRCRWATYCRMVGVCRRGCEGV